MTLVPEKVSFSEYLKKLISNSSDIFSIVTVVLFAMSVAANWVKVPNENINTISNFLTKFSTPLLFFLLLRSSYNIWRNEVPQVILPKFTLVPREKSFQLTNPGTVHPDSQCNIFFEVNVSNSAGLGVTLKEIKLENEKVFTNFFSEQTRTRIVDLQNNHKELNLPINIANGSSQNFHIEIGYAPMNIQKVDVEYPNIPSHIIDFALKAKEIKDFTSNIEISYMLDGKFHKETLTKTISFSMYKEYFRAKWLEYGWDDAVNVLK